MNKKYIITSESLNTRLDRWFRLNICDIPQSLIEKNIRKGNIKVNKKKSKSSYKLQKNDLISIFKTNFTPDKNKKKTEKYIPTKKNHIVSNLYKEMGFLLVEENEGNKIFEINLEKHTIPNNPNIILEEFQ